MPQGNFKLPKKDVRGAKKAIRKPNRGGAGGGRARPPKSVALDRRDALGKKFTKKLNKAIVEELSAVAKSQDGRSDFKDGTAGEGKKGMSAAAKKGKQKGQSRESFDAEALAKIG